MASQPIRIFTQEEYLSWERESETRHEFFDGEIIGMAGASFVHALIIRNLNRAFSRSLTETSCSEFGADLRIALSSTVFCYPDLLIACEPIEFLPGTLDTLINPRFVVEVLSPSTRGTDRNLKLPHYRNLPSLTGYLFIEQDRFSVEYGKRVSKNEWQVRVLINPADLLDLAPLPCAFGLALIYNGVLFEP